jgi:GT2 family glycosyltransferase
MKESSGTPLVSVILVCFNSSPWLTRCLASLRQQTLFDQTELVIVDNASADDSEGLARRLTEGWANARILQTGSNLGFSANNRGAEVARGQYLYLLNPDTWLEADCLERLYRTVEKENADGAGSTVLEYEDQTLQAKGSHGFDLFGNPVSPRFNRDPSPLFCIAGFYFINRERFLGLGMLDEEFFMYGEEMDLSWRIWLCGGRIVYVPGAKCHHRGAGAVNPEGGVKAVENRTSTQKRYLANRNFLLVLAKNCQHVLLVLLIPCALLIVAEGLATLCMTRSWSVFQTTCLGPFLGFWRLRGHVLEQRCRIKALRRRSDFWMFRFLRFGFGRREELVKVLRGGFPKFNR